MSIDLSKTYLRVCVLRRGHDGDHLPYGLAPDKDEFGNKDVQQPRCHHVDPVDTEAEVERFRVVFEMIHPHSPGNWHEVAAERDSARDALSQYDGLLTIQREGEPVRNPRIERAIVSWETVDPETLR